MSGDRGNAPSDSRCNASPEDLKELMKNFKIEGDEKDDADGRPNPYPQRPGEPDCKYYLRTGSCSYGSKCKYNHPTSTEQETKNSDELPQREDRPDCQFFLKTGFCKYGSSCKYNHPKDKHAIQIPPLNSFGLPLRKQDMESCSYFLKTGSCKFGMACKYDHPQLNNIGAIFPGPGPSVYGYAGYSATTGGPHWAGGYSAWLTSWHPYVTNSYMEGFPAYSSHALPTNQTTMPIQQGWCTYVAPSTITVSSMSSLGNNHAKPSLSTDGIFPERPDEPDCQYYLKTGTCKYGSSCKYNHPNGATQVANCIIGPYGLPHRPDSPKCKHYATHGNCKYGATCKFDHPIIPMHSLPGEPYPFRDGREITSNASNNSSFKVLKGLDQLNASTDASGEQDVNNNEHDGRSSALTSPNHPAPNSDASGNQSDEG
ncbi:zinc finger CCCH domain-containing protein 57-like isoform X1 [Curcuma longa]|uniref:zinc finger CCCH domain-containing protein 57-like isoform X1 n=1 Tax=Curcuma longa TaxID=136217 RepID=UPI003D9E9216